MISRIKGKLAKKEDSKITIELNGIFYDINVPRSVACRVTEENGSEVELVIYHYHNIDNNRSIPVMIGFIEELEKDFFEKFISVSGIGPKAALKAFDKPIAAIAQAIEEGDLVFLKTLEGIGTQKAKQIIVTLQGKVGRFALIKIDGQIKPLPKKEIIEEAKEVLKRLQYSSKEAEEMIKKVVEGNPQIDSAESLLNEIYRQRK